jgi:serine/threonine-protein kinase
LREPHSTGAALQRFLAEARAVAHLQHPGIVQIFDMGQHDGLPWFSLEFVDGPDLQKSLNSKPLDARSAATLVETICRTMQYAHSHGILHRDLKPANILLDAAGNPK